MHTTFTQKVILTIIAGMAAAALIQWYKVFITGADDALNKGHRNRTGISTPR